MTMKKIIKIVQLKLTNFKGVKKAEYDFDSNEMKILGDNGTGKTTIIDAFLWLLFNKNSANATDFSVKPIDEDGNVLHNADYSVEATFSIHESDGIECKDYDVVLKKVMREKWTKKRGETSPTFTGHETLYFKNDVPKLLKEYQEEVKNICDEDLFRMLTAPFYFNKLDKKVKRETLLKAVPNISDLSIIEKNIDFYPLINDLKGCTIEEIIAKCKANISSCNKDLPSFGFKIEELKSNITTKSEDDDNEGIENTKSLINHQKKYIEELKLQKNSKTNIEELTAINEKIVESKNQLFNATLNNQAKIEKEKEIADLNVDLQKLKKELIKIDNEKFDLSVQNSKITREINSLQSERADLEKQIEVVYKKCEEIDNLTFNGETTCPTCGQSLPQEKINQAIELFNLNKADKLQKEISKGKDLKSKLADLDTKLQFKKDSLINVDLEEINAKIANFEAQIEEKQRVIDLKKQEVVNIEPSEEMKLLEKQINDLTKQKEDLMNQSTSAPDLSLKIQEAEDELDKLFNKKAIFENNMNLRKRINELELAQSNTANVLRQNEEKLIICENFLKTKVKEIEKDVNSLFSKVKFTMFREQINGAYEEVCYATIDGVPFDDANNAAKINAGLDIIKTLQNIYGVKAPIFIDNSESITQFDEMGDTQLIKLYVVKNQKLEVVKEK